jgi:hypothetical protein
VTGELAACFRLLPASARWWRSTGPDAGVRVGRADHRHVEPVGDREVVAELAGAGDEAGSSRRRMTRPTCGALVAWRGVMPSTPRTDYFVDDPDPDDPDDPGPDPGDVGGDAAGGHLHEPEGNRHLVTGFDRLHCRGPASKD